MADLPAESGEPLGQAKTLLDLLSLTPLGLLGDPSNPLETLNAAGPVAGKSLLKLGGKLRTTPTGPVREQARRAITQGNPDFPEYPAPDQERLIENIAQALQSRNTREVEKALMEADVNPKRVLRIDPETLGPVPQQMPERVYAKADEAGYPLRVFHGSSNPNLTKLPKAVTKNPAYDFGFHAASEPATAGRFIAGPTLGNLGKGDTIYPLVARVPESRIIDMPDLGRWSSPLAWQEPRFRGPFASYIRTLRDTATAKPNELAVLEQLQEDAARPGRWLQGLRSQGSPYPAWQQYMKDTLEDAGFDAIRYKNQIEGLGEPSYLFLKPEQLRSPFAKFNPTKRETNNILASVLAALGLGATQLPENEP